MIRIARIAAVLAALVISMAGAFADSHSLQRRAVGRGIFITVDEFHMEPPRDADGLLNLFIQRFSRKDRPTTGVTWRAWNALSAHSFPGNVRELMHVIEHGVLVSAGGHIDLEHLPKSLRPSVPGIGPSRETQMDPLEAATRAFERSYLQYALEACGGQKLKAANLLGISRKNLWEKLKLHGLARSTVIPHAAADVDQEPAD